MGLGTDLDEHPTLHLDYRPPYEWAALLDFLRGRAIPGVEDVGADVYRRVVSLDGRLGLLEVRPDPGRPALRARVSPSLADVRTTLVARLRALFDLDARPDAVEAVLAADPALAPSVRRRPGLRVPGALDPFEATVRAILGQQVSVRAATTLAGRVAARFGGPAELAPGLTRRFPTAAELAATPLDDLAAVGLPRARAETVRAVARLFAADAGGAPGDLLDQLRAVRGIGDWTAEYVALRALHHPDAFPAGDLGVRKALGGLPAAAARARAEAWRPWRAYAVMHLWTPLPAAAPSPPRSP